MQKNEQARGSQPFGPTFFALAGFVNAVTLSPQPPAPTPEPVFRKHPILSAIFGRKRRQIPAVARHGNDAGGLSPTLGAIAGFVTTATGGMEPE